MQKNPLLAYMRHPGKLDLESLEVIRAIKDQYPFFTTVRLLLIRNLFQMDNQQYRSEIENTAAFVTDRRVLYELIHPLQETESINEEPVEAEPVEAGLISPEPVEPGTIGPEPVDPEPISPEPISPEPISPEPLIPEPLTVESDESIPQALTPEALIPETDVSVQAEPLTPESEASVPEAPAPDALTPESITPQSAPAESDEIPHKEAPLEEPASGDSFELLATRDEAQADAPPGRLTRPTAEPVADIPEPENSPQKGSPEDRSLRKNISNLLSLQLQELELIKGDEADLLPEIGLDIQKTYREENMLSGHEAGLDDLLTLDLEQDPSPQPEPPPAAAAEPVNSSQSGDLRSFTSWLSVLEKSAGNAGSEIPKTENVPNEKVLIDKFIETNPRLDPPKDNQPHIDISEDSVKEHDGIFTDTLARIYIKQGYYSKAIFAYEKLILKYPEKSGYFANQISEIKRLTNKK